MKKLLALLVSIMLVFSVFTFGMASTASAAVSGDFTYEMSGGNAIVTGFANGVDFQGELVIPDELGSFTIVGIDNDAFKDCTGITSVTIGEFIGSIGTNAFAGCTNLVTVNYNAKYYSQKHSAGSVDSPVFAGCTSLKTVNVGEKVESMPKFLFYGVATLENVNFAGEDMPKIGDKAFEGCPLVNIEGVTSSTTTPSSNVETPSSETETPSSEAETPSSEIEDSTDDTIGTTSSATKPSSSSNKKSDNSMMTIIIGGIIAVVVVILGGVIALVVLDKKAKKKAAAEAAEEASATEEK